MTALSELRIVDLEKRLSEVRGSIAFIEKLNTSSAVHKEREATIDKLRWHETDLVLALQNRQAEIQAVENLQTPLPGGAAAAHE